jgi:hypothetical protein
VQPQQGTIIFFELLSQVKDLLVVMEHLQLNLTFKTIRVYHDANDNILYRVTFNEEFPAYIKISSGEYVKAEVNYIDFRPRVLIAQLLEHVDNLHIIYTKKQETAIRSNHTSGFGAAEIGAVLTKAGITIHRMEFAKGEEYTDSDGEIAVHEYNGYSTSIVAVDVCDNVKNILQQAATNLLLG